jgi:Protein kinase domain/Ankyrin repeats (3 copies)/Ankyrin repeat
MLAADTIPQGRYRVVRPLGRGGMRAVYEATDLRLKRAVALKETLVETDKLRRAFERESRLLANLRHPALPKVLDHFGEGTGLFLVMEFIPGDDLGRLLDEGRAFTPVEVLRWAGQLLDALEYLHGLDPPVLHRDIKPANLKLISPGQIVLLDFGLAKGSAGQMTHTGSSSVLAYSPNYSPLEQMQGAGTDGRSDLYSLGATLYHLLTGVKPPDALTRATAVVNGRPDPLRPALAFNEEVPAAVSAALMRAMALNIENRPRTAPEMRDDLNGTPPRAAPTVPLADAGEITKAGLPLNRAGQIAPANAGDRELRQRVVVPLPEETWVVRKEGGGKRNWIVGAVLIAGLSVLSVALYFSFYGGEKPERAQTNTPAVASSPRPTPGLTPVENANRQENVNGQPGNFNSPAVVGPSELAARTKLEQRRIPYTEEAFTRVVEDGDTGAVELFLAGGMNPDAKDSTGRTALVNAASRGSDGISRKLLSKGADVNAMDDTGSTALMESARNGHQETTKVLLEKGADVNLTDNKGQTALLRAAAQGHSEIVRMLINKGARVGLKDRDGRDALPWARINNRSDVIDLLRKAGAAKP